MGGYGYTKKEEEPMGKYKHPDSTTLTLDYGMLRKWADECAEVKDWMVRNLPKEVFETKDIEIKKGRVYMLRDCGSMFLCTPVGTTKRGVTQYALVNISTGETHWGEHDTLENLNREHAHKVTKDLGPLGHYVKVIVDDIPF